MVNRICLFDIFDHSIFLHCTNLPLICSVVDKTRVGPRNEIARRRHRDWRKEEYCCESVSNSVDGVSSERIDGQELSEDNHFGWTVYGKAYGDPEFEKLMQFYEKPDDTGNAFQKKTYVLYLKEGTVAGRDAHTPMEDSKVTLPIGDLVTKLPDSQFGEKEIYLVQREEEENKDKKTNLISEFFFLPTNERSRSRSPKSGMSKQKLLGQLTDHAIVPISEAGDVSAAPSQEQVTKTNKIGTKTKKRKSLSRYLRAGSDIGEILTVKEKPSILKKISEFIINLKQSQGSKSRKDWEYLLVTPSGTNEYLYLSSKNNRNQKTPSET